MCDLQSLALLRRWLLLRMDRLGGTDLVMTQALIANMLGGRLEGVPEAALKLQNMGGLGLGLIRCVRVRIPLLERPGLGQRTSRVRWCQEGLRPAVD